MKFPHIFHSWKNVKVLVRKQFLNRKFTDMYDQYRICEVCGVCEGYRMNMPIYRAKKVDSDGYIIFDSFYTKDDYFYAITKIINATAPSGWLGNVHLPLTQKIDPSTLAIHFLDMLDSQGNKIFASLNEDGKGGDMIGHVLVKLHRDCSTETLHDEYAARFICNEFRFSRYAISGTLKVIGIQQ